MIEQFTRRMTDEEREKLIQRVTARRTVTVCFWLDWSGIWTFALMACIALIVLAISADANAVIIAGCMLAIIGVVIFCADALIWQGYFHWSRIERRFQREVAPVLCQAIDDGQVTVKRITATAVVELTAFEDEGDGYIYDLGDNQLFFMKGQWAESAENNMPWPNSEFEIVRTRIGDHLLGIFCLGEELVPVRTVPLEECKEDVVWEEFEEVVIGDLDAFANSLLAE